MGEIVSIFPKFFSRKFFTNTLHAGLTPLIGCQNVIYGGDTEGGRGLYDRRTPMPRSGEVGILLITLFSK
jgi:hypothetical protein